MPEPAIDGTYEHPGIPGALVTAGRSHLTGWANQHCSRPRRLSCDIETFGVGTDGLRIKCVVLATESVVAVFDPRDPFQHQLLAQLIAGVEQLIFHSSPFDVPSLVYNQLAAPQVVNKVVDIVIYARMAEPGDLPPKTLEALSHRHLGLASDPITNTFKVLGFSKKDGFLRLDIDSPAYLYGAAADGIATARLEPVLIRAAHDQLTTGHPFSDLQPQRVGWAMEEVEKHQRFNRITLRRTVQGLRIDEEFLTTYREINGQDIRRTEAELEAVGVKPGNGNSVTAWLLKNGALPPDHPYTAGGEKTPPRPSSKADDLEAVQHPVAKAFVRHKQLVKVDKDYLQKCMDLARPDAHGDLRIHPETSILKAAHGRTSMGGPPIHQFPTPARGIILPDRGDELASTDWAQQEPVIGLNLAGDLDPLADYELRGKKIYAFVSQIAGIPYKPAKVVILGGMYGEGVKKLSTDLGLDPGPYVQKRNRKTGEMETIATYAAARDLQERIFGQYGALGRTGAFLRRIKAQAKQIQQVVTINGRVLPIPSGYYEGRFSVQSHKGPNYEICGSATDQWVDTVLELDRRGLAAGLYFGMHDEGLTSVHIRREMQQIMEIPPEGLIRMARRTPRIRTDSVVLGERWDAA